MEIAEIKQQLSIGHVLDHYNLSADKNNMLRCPFHDDKTPSLQIYPQTNTFCCFSSNCKAGTGVGFLFDHGYSKTAGTAGIVGAVNGGEYPRTGSDFAFSIAVGAKTGEDAGALWASGIGNTFRHFVGQALVTSAFGEDFAKDAGDFHEREGGFSTENRDDVADMINNAYGRDFGKGFDINELAKSPKQVADFLNAAAVQVLKSTDYGKNDAVSKIISGQEKIFSSDSKVVMQLHYAISKAILDGAGKN